MIDEMCPSSSVFGINRTDGQREYNNLCENFLETAIGTNHKMNLTVSKRSK